MATNIATVLNECVKEFTELTSSGALTQYDNEVSKHRWLDEFGRLRIWAGNIGAHQTGQSSLDYRLRDASHLKNETVKLLQRLLRVLRDLADVMKDEDPVEDEDYDETFFEVSDGELEDDNDMTDIQMLFQSLRNTINLLFQISMAIRRPADHDRLLGVKIKDESYFEPWAQQHISHKFPNAMVSIIPRLGAAMARQKGVLKYFERHRAKLGQGLSGNGDQLSETVATEMVSADHLQFLETNSTSGISQTSYAPSIFTSNESLSVPNPPKESADENPFECPYCYLVIKIKGKKDWARHVFRDLTPYVCISTECSTPSKLYESRRQWYDHMCQSHSMLADLQSGSNCPLCQVQIRPPLTFDRHVGHHMEQLALFVLPRTIPTEEAFPGTASNAASLADVGDESILGTDPAKEHPQIMDETNFDDEHSYLENLSLERNHVPPVVKAPESSTSSFRKIEETTGGSSPFSYTTPKEHYDRDHPISPRGGIGKSKLEGSGFSPNSGQADEDVPRKSRERTEKGNSHSFLLDGDMGDLKNTIAPAGPETWMTDAEHFNVTSSANQNDWMSGYAYAPDTWQVDEATRTISQSNNPINDLEGGSSSHDGKKKAE